MTPEQLTLLRTVAEALLDATVNRKGSGVEHKLLRARMGQELEFALKNAFPPLDPRTCEYAFDHLAGSGPPHCFCGVYSGGGYECHVCCYCGKSKAELGLA